MKLLNQPLKIFLLCLAFATLSLVLNGTFLQLYRLHRDRDVLQEQIKSTRLNILDLDKQLRMAKDPVFIERQARDNYDLVDEHDLMFVFSEE
ncbi:MAG: septum formation initiator family protein [Pseudobdellovibrionaceae bacterium]